MPTPPALTKAELLEDLYLKTKLNRSEIRRNIEIMLSLMKDGIKNEGSLLLSGFGKFEAYAKAARKGRNPATDEAMTLDARRVLVFRLSKKFRAEMNGE